MPNQEVNWITDNIINQIILTVWAVLTIPILNLKPASFNVQTILSFGYCDQKSRLAKSDLIKRSKQMHPGNGCHITKINQSRTKHKKIAKLEIYFYQTGTFQSHNL